jgi:hypothetical protein
MGRRGAHSSDDVRFDAAAICCAAIFHAAGAGRVSCSDRALAVIGRGDRASDPKACARFGAIEDEIANELNITKISGI